MDNWTKGATMRERIAAAIMRAYFSRPMEIREMNVTVADQLDLVDAVLEALREPTIPVLNKLEDLMDCQGHYQSIQDSWAELINAALTEGQK